MTTLLALDPGGCTGFSIWSFDPWTPLTHLEHGQIEGGVHGFIDWWDERTHAEYLVADPSPWQEVVAETFVLDGRTMKPDVTPLRIEGVLDYVAPGWIGQRNIFKAHADDLTLKRLGFWWPGEQHARDSARHALAYMKTTRHLPSITAFWPPHE